MFLTRLGADVSLKPGEEGMKEEAPSARCTGQRSVSLGGLLAQEAESLP